jgi:hypothetical protein
MRGNVDSHILFMFTVTTESMIGQERKKVRSPRGPRDFETGNVVIYRAHNFRQRGLCDHEYFVSRGVGDSAGISLYLSCNEFDNFDIFEL